MAAILPEKSLFLTLPPPGSPRALKLLELQRMWEAQPNDEMENFY